MNVQISADILRPYRKLQRPAKPLTPVHPIMSRIPRLKDVLVAFCV